MTTQSSSVTEAEQKRAGWLSTAEYAILESICETFFPSLEPPTASSETLTAYYQRSAQDLHLAQLVAETLLQESPQTRADFHTLLALMKNPLTGLLLAGSAKAFTQLSQEKRQRYLLAMANSPSGQLRQGYQALKRLTGFLYFSIPDAEGSNPNWTALDYTAPEPPQQTQAEQPIQPLNITEDTTLDADAVVIGSGAGGGVIAAELARAGKSVIVVEQGGYNNEANFTLQEAQATSELYLGRGTLATRDLGILLLAGSTLGGGTTVNWTTSLRARPDVLAEWDATSGLHERFTGSQLQESYAAVEKRISVNTENSAHNRQNQLLADGCGALGYHSDALPRNAVGCEQRCGTCGFGCRYGSKQSTMKTYLQDAFEHGARIITHCHADKVLIENGQARGIQATITNGEQGKVARLTIHARAVIVAAGALNTPALLLRSGLENPHIGRHLHLHPVVTVSGDYAEKVYPWQGVMQSAYSEEFTHLSGTYGYTLEVPPTHPGLIGLTSPWYDARSHREMMLRAAHLANIIVLARDKGEGHIVLDAQGAPLINYVTSVFDRRHLLHGLRTAARIHIAAGATGITTAHSKPTVLQHSASGTIDAGQWRAFDTQLERHGLAPNRLIAFSAHQMGTCRMGADPRQGGTDKHGAVFGVKGLFVSDGSLFPAASGVNPMLTIMALVHSNGQYIRASL